MSSLIAAARQAIPHLKDYTDQEIANALVQMDGITPDNKKVYSKAMDATLGYDRTAVDATKDLGVGIGQGLLGLAKLPGMAYGAVMPGEKTFDNPVYNYVDSKSKMIEKDKSAGLQNREAGAAANVEAARSAAEQGGAGFWGQIGAEGLAKGGNYVQNPQLLVQDAAQQIPQLFAGGVIGRGAQLGAEALGLGAKGAFRVGLGTSVGSNAAQQGSDAGGQAYEELRKAGVGRDEASSLANTAAVKAGTVTAALAALPFGTTLERSLLKGASAMTPAATVAAVNRFGLGKIGQRGAAGLVEGGSEAFEEGYGQYAQNQAVAEKVAGTNLASGVGNAAMQGFATAGPMGAVAHHGAHPRTVTGEIDLTGTPVGPTELDTPTYSRRALDPLNERPVGPTMPPGQQAAAANQRGLRIPVLNDMIGQGVMRVASDGTVMPANWSDEQHNNVDQFRGEPPLPTLTDVLAPPDGIPVLKDVIGSGVQPAMASIANPPFVPKKGEPAAYTDLVAPTAPAAENPYAANPVVQTPPVTRGQVLSALAQANKAVAGSAVRADGQVAGTKAAAPLRSVLESKDPAAAIRSLYEDGSHPRDELLDNWHKNLTGETVSDFKAKDAQNSAGFVAEPAAQVDAQIAAVKEGRKDVAVLGEQEAAKANLTGLATGVATDATGAKAVVVSVDAKKVAAAVKRAPKVGLKVAMGEALGHANPTLTTETNPDAAVVQHVDDKTGQVINEQLATPADAANIAPVDGATPRVVSAEQALAGRQVKPLQPWQKKAAAKEAALQAQLKTANENSAARAEKKAPAKYENTDAFWNAERPTETAKLKDGSDVTISYNSEKQAVEAHVNGERVGDMAFGPFKEGPGVADQGVEPAFQRKGVATAMTAYAKKHIAQFVEAPAGQVRTNDGEALRESLAAKEKPTQGVKLGKKTTAELVEIAETAKGEQEYKSARYELFKRWSDHGSETAEKYLTNRENRSNMSKAEEAGFKQQYAAELKARGEKKSAKLAGKFGQTKFRTTETEGATTAPGNVTVEQAQAIGDVMTRKWKNAPKIEVVATMDDLPSNLRDDAAEQGATNAKGAYQDGTVYIVAGNHASASDIAVTVLHEIAGHHGLRGLLGDTLTSTMANIYNTNADVRHAADIMMRDEGLSKEVAVEEVLADVAEQGKLTLSMIERIGNSIRQVLRKTGLSALANGVTNAEVKALIIEARDFVEQGRMKKLDATPTVFRDATVRSVEATDAELRALVKGNEISRTVLKALTLRQIAEQYGSKLPALHPWIDAIMSRGAKASDLAARADRIARTWESTVPKAERTPLADVLLRASDAEVELDNTSAKYLADLTTKQRAEYDSLRKKLASLSPEAQAVRKDVIKTLREQWQYTRDSLETFINQTVADPQMRNARIEDLKHEMGRNRGDYFPLARFGDRVVIAKGAAADGRDIVSFHENEAGANAAAVAHLKTGVKMENVKINMKTDFDAQARASGGFVGQVHELIDNSGVEGTAKEELHQALQTIFMRSMPELSGAKSLIRRENVEGFSRDALRVFADAVTRGARYASHLEFAPLISAARESAEQQSKSSDKRVAAIIVGRKEGAAPKVVVTAAGVDKINAVNQMKADGYDAEFTNAAPETAEEKLRGMLESATDAEIKGHLAKVESIVGRSTGGLEDMRGAKALYNHMIELQNLQVKPNAAVDAMGQLGHVWYLGLSPSQWATNLLQNWAVGLPQLGHKYGVAKAGAEILSASSWFVGVRMGKLWSDYNGQFSVEWMAKEVADGNLKGISKDELAMLQSLQDHKALDFTQAMDLNRISQAGTETGAFNHAKYKALRFAAAGAHHTEVFNRVTYALAAYRLAKKSDGAVTHEQAVRHAENDTFDAHYDYSPENAPMVMRGNFSRMVFMFQKYRQHQLYWWAKNVKLAVQNESPGDRKKALQAALLMGTTQIVLGGVRALPMVGTVAFLANMFAGKDDDGVPFDFNDWINTAAKDIMGEKPGELFAQGIFGAMGMNIATRIGQGGILLNEGSEKYERNRDDKLRAYLFDLLGPVGSMALGTAKAYDKALQGDLIGAAAATTPKVISDALKGYQLSQEGLVDHKKGLTISAADRFDASDVMMQSLGVTPRALSDLKADHAKVSMIDQALKDQSHQLVSAYVQAWQMNDQEGMGEAVKRIGEFNNTAPKKFQDAGLLIGADKLIQAVMRHQQDQQRLMLTSGSAATMRQMQMATGTSLNTPVTRETIQQNRAKVSSGQGAR